MPRLLQSHGPLPSVVADRIRAERERLGLTQVEAARRLGIERSTYRLRERHANPQLSTLLSMRAIGFDLRAIVPELFG